MWLRGLHWGYQPELFEWEVSLGSGSERPWRVWRGWRRGGGGDALVFEGRGQVAAVPGPVMVVGKGIPTGTDQRQAAKAGRKNVTAKDSTGGRRLWEPKIRWRSGCVSFRPFLVKDGGVDALAGRRSVCLVVRLLSDSICFLCETAGNIS